MTESFGVQWAVGVADCSTPSLPIECFCRDLLSFLTRLVERVGVHARAGNGSVAVDI